MDNCLKKLLPYSRNVFVIILLSFIFRMLTVATSVTTLEIINFIDLPNVAWLDSFRGFLDTFGTFIVISEPMLILAQVLPKILDPLNSVSLYLLAAPIPLIWFICCLANRRIVFNLQGKSFWFFVICQPYFMIFIFIQGVFSSIYKTFPQNIWDLAAYTSYLIATLLIPLLCWWGVEKMHAQYLSETNAKPNTG